MMVQTIALAVLMARCAPNVAPSTMTAIVRVESGGDPLAIGDNTAKHSYHPRDRASGEALARRLIAAGHSLDLGIAQIDNLNFASFGVNVHTIFDPCTNLSVGSRILSADYTFAAQQYGGGQVALRHAIGMYNTGRLNAGQAYVRHVLAAAGILERHPFNPQVMSVRDVRRSAVLVRAPIAGQKSPSNPHRIVTPSHAPILITIPRTSSVRVF